MDNPQANNLTHNWEKRVVVLFPCNDDFIDRKKTTVVGKQNPRVQQYKTSKVQTKIKGKKEKEKGAERNSLTVCSKY